MDALQHRVLNAFDQDEIMDIDRLAIELSSRYPQSGLPIDVICSEIEKSVKAIHNSREARP